MKSRIYEIIKLSRGASCVSANVGYAASVLFMFLLFFNPPIVVTKDRSGKVISTETTQNNGRTLKKGSDGRVIEKTYVNKSTKETVHTDSRGVVTHVERGNVAAEGAMNECGDKINSKKESILKK